MYCEQVNKLVVKVSAASTRYFEASSMLVYLVGRATHEQFRKARRDCQVCKDDCTDATEALRIHREVHGC